MFMALRRKFMIRVMRDAWVLCNLQVFNAAVGATFRIVLAQSLREPSFRRQAARVIPRMRGPDAP